MTSTEQGQYIYGIIRTDQPQTFDATGMGADNPPVYTLNAGSLAAVVSDTPLVEYEQSRRHLVTHTKVLEEVMTRFDVLPVRFGTVATNPDAIKEKVLIRRSEEFNTLLYEMKGRREMGLKAVWFESVFEEVIEENPSIKKLRDSLVGKDPDATYYQRIELGQQIEAALNAKRDADSETILSALRPHVYKTKLNSLLTERMVINAAFLINAADEPAFDAAVQALDADLGERMKFKYVGPVPPYNFVNIIVRWDEG